MPNYLEKNLFKLRNWMMHHERQFEFIYINLPAVENNIQYNTVAAKSIFVTLGGSFPSLRNFASFSLIHSSFCFLKFHFINVMT